MPLTSAEKDKRNTSNFFFFFLKINWQCHVKEKDKKIVFLFPKTDRHFCMLQTLPQSTLTSTQQCLGGTREMEGSGEDSNSSTLLLGSDKSLYRQYVVVRQNRHKKREYKYRQRWHRLCWNSSHNSSNKINPKPLNS